MSVLRFAKSRSSSPWPAGSTRRSRGEPQQVDPGRVFDLTLPLDEAAEGYRAMDERRAIKTLLRV